MTSPAVETSPLATAAPSRSTVKVALGVRALPSTSFARRRSIDASKQSSTTASSTFASSSQRAGGTIDGEGFASAGSTGSSGSSGTSGSSGFEGPSGTSEKYFVSALEDLEALLEHALPGDAEQVVEVVAAERGCGRELDERAQRVRGDGVSHEASEVRLGEEG